MKKFMINCIFGSHVEPFAVYIGRPQEGSHPLYFQNEWLSKTRGGQVPSEVMEAISQLQVIAKKNKVLLEELCVYALGSAKQKKEFQRELVKSED